jgi:hypothetical protein
MHRTGTQLWLQVEPPEWHDGFVEWHAWLAHRARAATLRGRAARQHARFRLRLCLNYWRFFRARNDALRRAWRAAVQHREALVTWAAFAALRAAVKIGARERRSLRGALRQWSGLASRGKRNRKVIMHRLLVRVSLAACCHCPALDA